MRPPLQPEEALDRLRHLLEQARRIHCRAHALTGLRNGLLTGAGLALFASVLHTLGWLDAPMGIGIAGLGGPLCAIGGAAAGWARPGPTDRTLALALDRALGTHELHLTAAWLADPSSQTPTTLETREVWQRLVDRDPSELRDLVQPTRWRALWAALPVLAVAGLLWSQPPMWPTAPAEVGPVSAVREEGQRLAEHLNGDPEGAAALPPEVRQQLTELADAMLAEELDADEARERLEALRRNLEAQNADGALDRLQDAAEALDQDLTSELGQALAQGDPKAMAEAARAFEEQMQSASASEREQVASAMEQAASRLSQSGQPQQAEAAQSMQRAADALRDGTEQSGLSDEQSHALQEAMERAQDLSQQAAADRAALRESQELNGAMQQAEQRLQAATEGQPGSGEDGEDGEDGKDGNSGQKSTTGTEGSNPGEGQGESPGDGTEGPLAGGPPQDLEHTWEDQGEFTEPTDTRGHGDRIDETRTDRGQRIDDFERFYKSVRMEGAESLVAGSEGALDESGQMDTIRTRLTAGEEQAAPSVTLPPRYREAAEAAMSEEPIPPGYRETIRTYFDAETED